ncbi:LPXTG cell wall anchor domain-containing protein [Rothia mucilaginosa]|uniref:LPXTG cell wall anchor domain-containing protein n=1 Tax=Rothia mucilaginosa TaxID=43675 RepID=UPI001CAC4A8A|nr:LPXTG cell wall anchor domain-containing protein [Rothia mucilaginosa]MBF1641939.1 LPXTG cell wall anchor domain-containing protein [Rothia mucilaginosa]MBF1661015.1 LPXTG cell wall anchor domain-containing protein [Rothia mucilaginosa]UQF82371.1 MAG: LPXTG cell wall anchor domain-containing protein [Rothia mucilaginosa]
MNLTPSSGKALKGLAVGSLALAISGAAMIPASFAAPNTAHQTASPSASAPSTASLSRVVDTSASVAQITQGLPGQYQVAYSKATNKIWMVGVGARGDLASTIARVNADTLQIEEVAALPFELDKNGEFGYISAYGITVDDVSGTVWVTNTTDNSLSVFDQSTMEQIWTNHGISESDPNWIEHPRSVLVDHNSGKVFVTGRYYVSAIDMKTFQVTKLQLEGAPNGGTRYIGMNMTIDGDKLYVPERTGGKVFVINTHTFKTEQVIQTRGENSSVEVRPSDVTIDHSENEIYVSSQGVDGVNSGISVYDLTTGAFKKFVKFGTQALSMENDEDRDLVYVTDFGTGKIAIFDAKTDRVIGEVEMNGGKANDLTVTEDGSVIAVDKQDIANTTAAVPYVLNSKTGDGTMTDTYTSKATVDRNGKAVPSSQQKLVPNSIVKFHAEVSEGEFTSTATINPAKVPFQGYPKQATAVLIDPTLNFAEGTVDITRPYTFHVSGYDFEKPPAEGIRLFLVKEGEWSMGYDKLTDSELANIQKVSTVVPASAFVYNARTGKYSFDATLRVPANTMQYSQGYMLGTVTAGSDVATNRNYDSAVSLIVNDAKDAGNADNRDEVDEPAFPTNASASPSASAAVAEKKPAVEQPKGEQSKAEDANDQLGTTAKTAPLKNSSSVKSESQPKGSSSDAQVNASATKSAPQSKGSLAKTGAQNVLSLAAVGAFALIAGAAVMVLRRRKA